MTKIMLYRYHYIYWGVRFLFFLFFSGGGSGDPYFFLHNSSSWVKIRLHTKNQLPRLSGSALKVSVVVVGWGGGGPTKYFVTPNLS